MPGSLMAELKMHWINFFYVCLNLSPALIPAAGGVLWKFGSRRSVVSLFALAVADFLIPLKKDGPWPWWCRLTNTAPGKISYHSAEVILEEPLEKEKNYMMLYHPHSLWAYGFDMAGDLLHKQFGITAVATGADAIFSIPWLRRVMTWWGLTRVTRKSLLRTLTFPYPRNVVFLSPGGIAEMFYGIDEEQLVLAKRKGFCKVALEGGTSLVPLYVFGANELFTRYWGPDSWAARFSKRISTSIVVWTGRFGLPFGFIAHKTKLVVVIGKPIHVDRVDSPTQEQVDELHAKYVDALRKLFHTYKGHMGKDWPRQMLYMEDETPVSNDKKGR
mmetsp:Transcript_38617/g.70247  ORF Transcript_38617/g.70247 Transcript_38617/m.70247 type:complete len:330 (+) Transcript_38617:123-1112(+)